MSPGARGDFLADRPAPGRRDVAPPKPNYGYPPPPYYPGVAASQANSWLGAPLISMANQRRGCKPFPIREDNRRREETYSTGRQAQFTKMAMHAQGAPLVIQSRYQNQKKYIPPPETKGYRKQEGRQFVTYDRCDKIENNFVRNAHTPNHIVRSANMDAVSVTSDESSGSANSEAALPRIIKPRKRRKKDRKPTNIAGGHEIVTRKHDVNEDSLEPQSPAPGSIFPCSLFDDSSPPMANYRGDATVPYRGEVKYFPEHFLKHYSFSGLSITDSIGKFGRASNMESTASVCQCRYCDPSGQIWDIDSVGFSELFDESSSVDFAPTKLEDSMKVVGSNSKKGEVKDRDTTLRRSWSDPSSSHSTPARKIETDTASSSLEYESSSASDLCYSLFSSTPLPSRAGSIFGRNSRLSSEGDASTYRLVPDLKLDSKLDSVSVNLEVSSEIVTSLNGHRDLEIRFFSTSPPANTARAVSFFAENSLNSDNTGQSETIKETSEVLNSESHSKCSSEISSEVT